MLASEHAGVRYSAIAGLEFLFDDDVREAFESVLKTERNTFIIDAIKVRLH